MSGLNTLKIMSCTTFALFIILTTLVLVRRMDINSEIANQIQNLTVLKDSSFSSWASQPDPMGSQFTQNFTLYEIKMNNSKISSQKSNYSQEFDYTFKYENISFSQGNSGQLNFINRWELVKNDQFSQIQVQNISMLNLGADKIYNYDFYAPQARKMTVMYNTLIESLSTTFLLKFYTSYIHKFFFQNEELVLATVFEPLGFSAEEGKNIYEHPEFGWNNLNTFSKWVKLALKQQDNLQLSKQFEQVSLGMNLNQGEMMALVSEGSTLQNMILALNGTMKSKLLSSKYFSYSCQQEICSNFELLGAQIATGFLTSDELFAGLNLGLSTKEFNGTLLSDIEYMDFCSKNPDLQCLDQESMMLFFTNHNFGSFEKTNIIFENQEKYDFIENYFQLPPGTSQSIIKFTLSLYKALVGDSEEIFSWSLTTYNNFEKSLQNYKQLFITELYSRAFFLSNKQQNCKDYYAGQFNDYSNICDQNSWDFKTLDSVRNYIEVYFFYGNKRTQFEDLSNMSPSRLISFLHQPEESLFAKQISQIEKLFSQTFKCSSKICKVEQVFCLQWGQEKILSNLPESIFGKKQISILEWDEQKTLNGFIPDYAKVTGDKVGVEECQNMLSSSEEGIYNLFNLIKIQEGNENGKLLNYISSVVLKVSLKGQIYDQSVEKLFSGQESEVVESKINMNVETGGASWLDKEVFLFKVNNKDKIKVNEGQQTPQYDRINTGIYDSEKLRDISRVWGQKTSSSKYMSFNGTKKVDGKEILFQIVNKFTTQKQIRGTNMFGFQPNVNDDETLTIYFPWSYKAIDLKLEGKQNNDELNYNRYSLSQINSEFVGIEELNRNFIQIDKDSYIKVEPMTGFTLEFNIKFTCKMSPLFTRYLAQGSEISVYESTLHYKRQDADKVLEINQMKTDIDNFFFIGLIVVGAMLVFFLLLTVLYCVKAKKENQLKKESLLGSTESPLYT